MGISFSKQEIAGARAAKARDERAAKQLRERQLARRERVKANAARRAAKGRK